MADIQSVEKSRNGDLSNSGYSDVAAIIQQEQLASAPKKDDTHESKKITTWSDCEAPNQQAPVKRRKTRRGKTKRRNITHPYMKPGGSTVLSKPEAPYNSNRFLIEDHGDDLDDDFDEVKPDQASTSTVTRTRDSSFSMEDSDGPTDTPYCEFPTLIKDFDNQYESLQVERLQSMSKDELIQEFMRFERMMERKVQVLVEQLKKRKTDGDKCQNDDCRKEVQRLTLENDILRQENDSMKASMNLSTDSDDSADSESDSEDSSDSVSDSSTSSLSPSRPPTPPDSNPSSGGEHNQQPVLPILLKE